MAGSVSLGIMQIAGTIFLWVDSFLISVYLGPKSVAFYGIAFSVIITLNALGDYFMRSLLPTLSRKAPEQLGRLLQKASYVMLAIGLPTALGGIVLRVSLIKVLSGSSYLQAATPLAFLMGSIVFTYVNNVFGYACIALNRVSILMWTQLPAILFNVVINMVGIPRYGIDAAAVAVLATEVLAVAATWTIFARRLRITIPLWSAWKPALAAGAMVGVAWLSRGLWHSDPALVQVLVGTAVLGSAYVLVLMVLRGVPEDLAAVGTDAGRRLARTLRRATR